MTRSSLFPLLLASLSFAAAPAAAQEPTPSPSPSPTATPTPPPVVPTPTPAPPEPEPERIDARVGLRVVAPHKVDGRELAVKGETMRVTGRMRPAIPGQRVVVEVTRGNKVIKRKRMRISRMGTFKGQIRLRRTGSLRMRALLQRSQAASGAKSSRRSIRVLSPNLTSGSSGPLVTLFTRGLSSMKYAIQPVSTFDDRTGRAVMAYRKVNGLPRLNTATPQIVRDVLARKGAYKVRFPKLGRHVEADLSQQVLALVDGKRLIRVYHTSSGTAATPTIRGTYSFYSKTIGTNSKGMVHSNYFIRGYAIHGYISVPPYGASHGCLRVPIPDALNIYNWIQLGDKIRVTI